MTNYTFNFFGITNENEEIKANPPSKGQIKFYSDLCKQKRVKPRNVNEFTYDTMSEEIQRLLAYHPASDSQIKLINDKVKNLNKLMSNLNFTEEQIQQFEEDKDNVISIIILGIIKKDLELEPIISKLTGGMEGTASKLIEGLISVERHFNEIQPPSPNQLKLLTSMFLCPDVAFEDYGVSRKIELEDGMWRKPSPEEFAEKLKENFTYSKASEFLNKYRGQFHEWKKTRIRPEQMRYIMQLESYMGNDNTPGVVEVATTMDGEVINLAQGKEYINGAAFVPHTEEQLIQFSIEQASQYIDQLKAELDRVQETSFVEPEIEYMELRSIDTIEDTISFEYEELNSLMYKLEAIAGYDDEELHQAASIELIQNDSPEANKENRLKIRNFMKELLYTDAISLYELLELTKSCPTAQKILIDF